MGAAVGIVVAALAVGTGVYTAVAAENEADSQARHAKNEAENRANAARRQYEKLRKQQKVAFLNSGVSLEGSPLLVLEATREEGVLAANDVVGQGSNTAKDLNRQGRSAFIGNLASGIGSGVKLGAGVANAEGGVNSQQEISTGV